jgi:hypothetical protein
MNMNNGLALVCALLVSVSTHVSAHANAPMTFSMEVEPDKRLWEKMTRGVEDIYATGEITNGTTDELLTFVREHKVEAAEIHFNSPGGSLAEGMKLGQAIRTLQFYTTVGVYNPKYAEDANLTSICASACAYAFAGGTSRFLNEYTGKLGIHQFYTPDNTNVSSEAVQQISGLIVAYLDEMGIDAKAFTISTIADRNGMIWLTPEEALTLRFANNGNDAPVAEIKLAGMTPYLRVQQDHHNVTVRALFNCENKRIHIMFGIVSDPTSAAMFAENQKRSYLELDNNEFLVIPGKAGASANESVTWISRILTPATLVQIIKANNVGAWIDGFGAVRYGGTLDMPTVRSKITDFAEQCYGITEIVN